MMARLPQLGRDDRPIAIASLFVLLILAFGSIYTLVTQGNLSFIQPVYLLQQLQVGAFLGIVAAGAMLVILLGHIDLSVPWTLAAGAMMATAVGGPLAIPTGLGVGLLVGLVNGLGVAYLRVPSMIFTLGMNAVLRGLMVVHTGGFAPQTRATPLMGYLATGRLLGLPMALVVWIVASLLVLFLLQRTVFGRYVYGIGNREAAAYLSGVDTRAVIVGCFALCGMAAAMAGVLLAGYSTKGLSGHGRRLPPPRHRRRRHRWHQHPGRQGPLFRHRRRHGPDHASYLGALGHADAGSRPPGDLWPRHHRHALGLRPRCQGRGLIDRQSAGGYHGSRRYPMAKVLARPPDRPADDLYKRDFYTWCLHQAELVRTGQFSELDIPNVVEELESLGSEQESKLESSYRILLIASPEVAATKPNRRTQELAFAPIGRERLNAVPRLLKRNPGLESQRAVAVLPRRLRRCPQGGGCSRPTCP